MAAPATSYPRLLHRGEPAFSGHQQQRAAELEAFLVSTAVEQTRETFDQSDPRADRTIRLAVAWGSLDIIERTPELIDSATSAPAHHVSVADARDAGLPNNTMKRTPKVIDSKRANGSDPPHQATESDTFLHFPSKNTPAKGLRNQKMRFASFVVARKLPITVASATY